MIFRRTLAAAIGFTILAIGYLMSVPSIRGHEGGVRVFNGRMTGGGSIFTDENDLWAPAGTRITHGFELQCDSLDSPNNLQIDVHLPNGESGRFHLDELQYATCWAREDIHPTPPSAPFDVYVGLGIGRYNGVPGYCTQWVFTDAGEPGTEDRIEHLRIWHPSEDGNCALEDENGFVVSIYLDPGHALTFGNHQAHKESGKK